MPFLIISSPYSSFLLLQLLLISFQKNCWTTLSGHSFPEYAKKYFSRLLQIDPARSYYLQYFAHFLLQGPQKEK